MLKNRKTLTADAVGAFFAPDFTDSLYLDKTETVLTSFVTKVWSSVDQALVIA